MARSFIFLHDLPGFVNAICAPLEKGFYGITRFVLNIQPSGVSRHAITVLDLRTARAVFVVFNKALFCSIMTRIDIVHGTNFTCPVVGSCDICERDQPLFVRFFWYAFQKPAVYKISMPTWNLEACTDCWESAGLADSDVPVNQGLPILHINV